MSLENDGVWRQDSLNRRRIHLREISGDGSPLESVGQDLRAARLRRGDEIAAPGRSKSQDHLGAGKRPDEDNAGQTMRSALCALYTSGLDSAQFVQR